MNKPIYRHLAEQKWRGMPYRIISQRISQLNIVPDVLPAFEPTLAVQLTFTHEGFRIPVNVGVLLTINRESLPPHPSLPRLTRTDVETAAQPAIALKSSTNIEGTGFLVAMVRVCAELAFSFLTLV